MPRMISDRYFLSYLILALVVIHIGSYSVLVFAWLKYFLQDTYTRQEEGRQKETGYKILFNTLDKIIPLIQCTMTRIDNTKTDSRFLSLSNNITLSCRRISVHLPPIVTRCLFTSRRQNTQTDI